MTVRHKKAEINPNQLTLFDISEGAGNAKTFAKPQAFPLPLAGIMADGKVPRLYQEAIARSALRAGKDGRPLSTFVIMPTGLGKTLIAFLAANPMLEKGKVLFIAPTGALVSQHAREAHEMLMLLPEEIAGVIGASMLPGKREAVYASDAKFIIATSNSIANDIEAGRLALDGFSLLISDEAQHSVGNHPHNRVAAAAVAAGVPIMALSASPGGSPGRIVKVMRNLGINNIELRTVHDDDVAPYVQSTEVANILVKLPGLIRLIGTRLRQLSNGPFRELHELGYLRGVGGFGDLQPDMFGDREAIAEDYSHLLRFSDFRKIKENIGNMPEAVASGWLPEMEFAGRQRKWHALSLLAQLMTYATLISRFETEGLHAGLAYARKNVVEAIGKDGRRKKYAQRICENEIFARMYEYLSRNIEELRENAKVGALVDALKNDPRLPGKPIIVNCKFRQQAAYLEELARKEGFSTGMLVGHGKGVTPKMQLDALNRFRSGEIKVLFCTSAGEEGIDIPDCAVINYDQVGSGIRSIQRAGRTGRNGPGLIINILAEGTMDVWLMWKARNEQKNMEIASRQVHRMVA